jgi:hypothetical protein
MGVKISHTSKICAPLPNCNDAYLQVGWLLALSIACRRLLPASSQWRRSKRKMEADDDAHMNFDDALQNLPALGSTTLLHLPDLGAHLVTHWRWLISSHFDEQKYVIIKSAEMIRESGASIFSRFPQCHPSTKFVRI